MLLLVFVCVWLLGAAFGMWLRGYLSGAPKAAATVAPPPPATVAPTALPPLPPGPPPRTPSSSPTPRPRNRMQASPSPTARFAVTAPTGDKYHLRDNCPRLNNRDKAGCWERWVPRSPSPSLLLFPILPSSPFSSCPCVRTSLVLAHPPPPRARSLPGHATYVRNRVQTDLMPWLACPALLIPIPRPRSSSPFFSLSSPLSTLHLLHLVLNWKREPPFPTPFFGPLDDRSPYVLASV